MTEQKIILIGNDDMVLMFGLLGIEGRVLDKKEDFIPVFEDLIKDITLGMIIIAIELSEEQISYLKDFKLNKKRPFIYFLPDILKKEGEEEIFLKSYRDIIKQLTLE